MLDKTTCFISNIFEKMLKKQVHYQTPRGFTTVVKLLLKIVYHRIRKIQ